MQSPRRKRLSCSRLCDIVSQILPSLLSPGLSVAKVREAIGGHVLDIPVLPSRFGHCLEEMKRASRPGTPDLAVDLTVLVPRPTATCPDQVFHHGVPVFLKVVNSLGFWRDGFDSLSLHLRNQVVDVRHDAFETRHERAVCEWTVGTRRDLSSVTYYQRVEPG